MLELSLEHLLLLIEASHLHLRQYEEALLFLDDLRNDVKFFLLLLDIVLKSEHFQDFIHQLLVHLHYSLSGS